MDRQIVKFSLFGLASALFVWSVGEWLYPPPVKQVEQRAEIVAPKGDREDRVDPYGPKSIKTISVSPFSYSIVAPQMQPMPQMQQIEPQQPAPQKVAEFPVKKPRDICAQHGGYRQDYDNGRRWRCVFNKKAPR